VRILLISHAPLAAELGAAQVALNLAAALRDRGHDALAWSPAPVPAGRRSFRRRQTAAVERFAAAHGPFDVIETPVTSASAELARAGLLVVRSIQPELLYLRHDIAAAFRRRPAPRTLAHALAAVPAAAAATAAIVAGWSRARLILCQGSLELEWMRRRFPRWRSKLGLWAPAPSPGEQAALAAVREAREARREGAADSGVRFLWIGRWTSHKGTGRLRRFLAERAAAFPADTFTLAGCGPEAGRDLARGREADLLRSGRLRLLPEFPRSGLPALLAAHEAGLFTSEVEGWGLCLNEMLESGLPVYATEAGGAPDLRPFFPAAVRPFPPPAAARLAAAPCQPIGGYLERFRWPAVAAAWERQVLAAVSGSPIEMEW
jgi:glycosyltransferase involved in cell wall biosynthesis